MAAVERSTGASRNDADATVNALTISWAEPKIRNEQATRKTRR
jgi:hypothetical protein